MATVAIRIRAGQRVIVVDVARRAGRRQVRARQRPSGRAVIKISRAPTRGRVACRAVRQRERSPRGGVHRSIGLLPGGQVATGGAACCRCNLQVVVVPGVAVRARHNLSGRRKLMQVLQRETRRIVAPRGSPTGRRVARGALRCREACRHVIRNRPSHCRRAVVLVLVAAVAIRIRHREIVMIVHMAGCAGRGGMRAGQRPSRGAVIKSRGGPRNRRVAGGAIRRRERRPRRRVRRIVRLLPGCQVAAGIPAIRWLNVKRVIPADVALGASRHFSGRGQLVRIGQRESRRAMVEHPVRPHRDRMAGRTSSRRRREIRSHVIRHIPANRLRAIP